jgi:hypothetical protein
MFGTSRPRNCCRRSSRILSSAKESGPSSVSPCSFSGGESPGPETKCLSPEHKRSRSRGTRPPGGLISRRTLVSRPLRSLGGGDRLQSVALAERNRASRSHWYVFPALSLRTNSWPLTGFSTRSRSTGFSATSSFPPGFPSSGRDRPGFECRFGRRFRGCFHRYRACCPGYCVRYVRLA